MTITLSIRRVEDGTDPFAFDLERLTYRRTVDGEELEGSLRWHGAIKELLTEFGAGTLGGARQADLGNLLRDFLLALGWRDDERTIRRQVGVRTLMTVQSSAAEIYALPWELCRLGPAGGSLATDPDVLLHYTTPTARDARPPENAARPALMVWAGALTEVAGHTEALAAAYAAFRPDRDVVKHGSTRALRRALTDLRPALLHILCHGTTTADGAPALAWEGRDGAAHAVTASQLGDLLAPHLGALRTVVLCVCHSGTVPLGTRLGSFARSLHERGVRAVVGSRTLLTQEGSTQFARGFHRELGAGASLGDAFAAGRYELVGEDSLDAFAVQLFARAADVQASSASRAGSSAPTSRPLRGLRTISEPRDRAGGRRTLRKYLLGAFDLAELDLGLREDARLAQIPDAVRKSSALLYFSDVVGACERRGLIPELLELALRERPRDGAEILAIAVLWGVGE